MTRLTPDIATVTAVEHSVLRLTLTVTADADTGTVVWLAGADLAPDTLYVRARTGAWTDQDFAA